MKLMQIPFTRIPEPIMSLDVSEKLGEAQECIQ